MKYRTKVIINGAELPDEQKDNASSITGVSVTSSCGNGFQIGSTASSMRNSRSLNHTRRVSTVTR